MGKFIDLSPESLRIDLKRESDRIFQSRYRKKIETNKVTKSMFFNLKNCLTKEQMESILEEVTAANLICTGKDRDQYYIPCNEHNSVHDKYYTFKGTFNVRQFVGQFVCDCRTQKGYDIFDIVAKYQGFWYLTDSYRWVESFIPSIQNKRISR